MTIVAPADADEMRRFMPLTPGHQGPIYIRLAKGYDPIVTNDEVPFVIGKAIPMRQGSDALIVTTGITLKAALDASAELSEQGIESAVLHVPTIKPLDEEMILEYSDRVPVIVTIEEHTIIGGLGSAVAELLAEADFGQVKRFKRIGLPDVFPDEYGTQDSLMQKYHLSSENLVSVITDLACRA